VADRLSRKSQPPSLFQTEGSKSQPPTSKNDAPPARSWSLGDWKFIGAHSAVAQGRLWMLEFGGFFGRAKDYVYFSTSSIVVSPAKMLRNPSWRSVTIPNSIAFCFKTTVGAR
jgi:hypothetical protein